MRKIENLIMAVFVAFAYKVFPLDVEKNSY